MVEAFIEHRPHAVSKKVPTSHYVIIANGQEILGEFTNKRAAKYAALRSGHWPVLVPKERHLQNRSEPDHWLIDTK